MMKNFLKTTLQSCCVSNGSEPVNNEDFISKTIGHYEMFVEPFKKSNFEIIERENDRHLAAEEISKASVTSMVYRDTVQENCGVSVAVEEMKLENQY